MAVLVIIWENSVASKSSNKVPEVAREQQEGAVSVCLLSVLYNAFETVDIISSTV